MCVSVRHSYGSAHVYVFVHSSYETLCERTEGSVVDDDTSYSISMGYQYRVYAVFVKTKLNGICSGSSNLFTMNANA